MNVQSTQSISFGQFKGAKGITPGQIPELVKLLSSTKGSYSVRKAKSHVAVVNREGVRVNLEGKEITDAAKMKTALAQKFPVYA